MVIEIANIVFHQQFCIYVNKFPKFPKSLAMGLWVRKSEDGCKIQNSSSAKFNDILELVKENFIFIS
jgi:hypothetical protein